MKVIKAKSLLKLYFLILSLSCFSCKNNSLSNVNCDNDFIINSQSLHFSFDTTGFFKYSNILLKIDSLTALGETDSSLISQLNPTWDSLKNEMDPRVFGHRKFVYDKDNVSEDFLKKNLKDSYKAWKENPYTKNYPEEIFCRHILPYRIKDGILPDDYFGAYNREFLDIVKRVYPAKIEDAVDSILVRYKDIKYSIKVLPGFPYLFPSAMMKTKRGECEDRIWFNYYMLRSAGFAVAIDFVPAWGNRNTAHTWNALIIQGGSIPFEPFYSTDRWEYKNIYNNIAEDGFVEWWGKFRLPKVYRYTYEIQLNDILKIKTMKKEDIPPLFRSANIKDVSEEYFDVVDVIVDIERPKPKKSKFIYLCVSKLDKWVPVDYARIRWGKAKFKKMGKDIVYLPAFYKNGIVIPAGDPFYLSQNGTIEKFKANGNRIKMNIQRRYPLNKKKDESNSLHKESRFILANKPDFSDSVLAATIDFNLEMMPYKIDNKVNGRFRYVRFLFNPQTILSELNVLSSSKVKPNIAFPSINKGERIYKLVDGDLGTPLKWTIPKDKSKMLYIDFDFGKPTDITQFQFCGINDIFHIESGVEYEIFYWDDKWLSLGGVKKPKERNIILDNVPEGALYYIDCHDKYTFERIFKYKDGKQIFY